MTLQIPDILAQSGGLGSMASELGVSEGDTAAGAAALLPSILGGLQNRAQEQPGGLAGLGGLLGQLGGGGLLDQVLSAQPTDVDAGNGVLGQIFGSKDVSRTVAQHAAVQSGLDPSLLRKMLPLLAMVVTGYLAKQHGAASAAAGAPPADAPSAGPGALGGLGGLGGMLGGILGGGRPGAAGGLGSLFDQNGDGNALDDILRMAGKALR
jgi:hypothetical protein